MSIITQWLLNNGFTVEMLLLVLYIPIIATLINVARYILGFKTLGIYAPLTLAYALYFTGIRLGIIITIIVVIAVILSFRVFKQIRMHYISRVTLNYTLITLILLLAIPFYNKFLGDLLTLEYSASTIIPAGIILIAALSDFYIKKYVKNSPITTSLALAETLIVAVIGWIILRLDVIQDFILIYPWSIVVLVPINILIGQYTGLRFKEYLRFRQVARDE